MKQSTKRILGYSRSSHEGGRIVKHHINEVANAVCVARRESTMVYVIEWDEIDDTTGWRQRPSICERETDSVLRERKPDERQDTTGNAV